MIQQLKLAAFVLLIGLAVVLLLAVMSDYASGGDYTVTRGTTITSQRPIWLLVLEAGTGVLNGTRQDAGFRPGALAGVELIDSRLRIDGRPAPGVGRTNSESGFGLDVLSGGSGVRTTLSVDGREQPGPTSVLAAWRLIGFILWDAEGRIERITDLEFRGRSVRIVDSVSNGRVWVRVTVGPPLGDPHVRCAVLELEVNDVVRRGHSSRLGLRGSTISLACSAIIDLPGDRCRLVRRIAERIADREAGAELASRVGRLAGAGRDVVVSGREQIDEIVGEFLRRACREQR